MLDESILEKFSELKKVNIIRDFKPIYKKRKLVDINIEFFDDLPPKRVLFKLDCYLYQKYGILTPQVIILNV